MHDLRNVYHSVVPLQAVPSVSPGPVHLPLILTRVMGSICNGFMP